MVPDTREAFEAFRKVLDEREEKRKREQIHVLSSDISGELKETLGLQSEDLN